MHLFILLEHNFNMIFTIFIWMPDIHTFMAKLLLADITLYKETMIRNQAISITVRSDTEFDIRITR